MKKQFLIIMLAAFLPVFALAQGWPAAYGGVMLQGFFWDSYLENPDFGPNGTQQQRNLGAISVVPHSNPWGPNIRHTWATMYDAGWGAGTDDWEVPLTSWANLEAVKDFVAPFIDLLWLPQSGATIAQPSMVFNGSTTQTRGMRGGVQWNFVPGDSIANTDCNGFVPYLWFDHGRGENYTYYVNGNPVQYTSMTYFGTEAELKSCIAAYKAKGCGAIEDVVINHKGFAGDFWIQEDYTDPSTGTLTSTGWTLADLVGSIYRDGAWTDWYMPLDGSGQMKQITGGGTGRDDGNYGGWANEVAHTSANAQRNTINYLRYLKDELGYAGFRYDYAAGLAPGRFAQYNQATTPTFSVGEFWTDTHPAVWIKNTASDGGITSAAFDFPLMSDIKNAFNSGDFQGLKDAGMLHDNILKRYAVNFIANHDTNKNLPTDTSNSNYTNRTNSNIVEANAFLLAMPGTPCLFWAHFMHPAWHDDICRMILARRAAGVTNESAIESAGNVGSNGVWWIVKGEHGTLLLQLGTDAVSQGNREGYTEVYTSAVCRLAISNEAYANADFNDIYNNTKPAMTGGYPVFDQSSGSYVSQVTVRVRPSTEGCTLVYTTNGENPTAASQQITAAEGEAFTFYESTDLRVGVLVGGQVAPGSIVRKSYVISNDDPPANAIKVYVNDPTGATPYIYAWDGDSQDTQYTGSWPGWEMNYTKQIGGITWREATIPTTKFNMVLSEGGDASKTHNINGVDHEVFYTFRNGIATDVTATFVKALHDPIVSIDRASGAYTGNLTVNLTSSVEGATIVYTIDRWNTDIADDAANRQSSTAANVPITFQTDGSHLVRAAILKDGQCIGKVARTYQLTATSGSAWQSSTPLTTGINLYIHTDDDAPFIHTWSVTNAGSPVSTPSSPTQLTAKKRTTADNKEWWYYHIDADVINFLICSNSSYGNQTADKRIDSEGCFFFDYVPGASFTECTSLYAPWSTDYPQTGANIFVKVNGNYNYGPNIHVWDSNDGNTSWPGSQISSTATIGGVTWYYKHFDTANMDFLLNYNGDADKTTDINFVRGANGTSYFIEYTPADKSYSDVSENYNAWHQSINFSQEDYAGGSAAWASATLPSCATWVTGRPFCYFENTTSMAVPSLWAWNDSQNLCASASWPGDELVDLVGISPAGHAIYRWTAPGTDVPASLIFSDGGVNATATLAFENGAYYTADGKQGVVPDNLRTLADLTRDNTLTVGKRVVLSNDLEVVFVNADGSTAYVKDRNGDCVAPSVMKAGQKVYNGTTVYNYLRSDFDQSNWVKLQLPAGGQLAFGDLRHALMAQTMVGTVTDADNLTIALEARPVADNQQRFAYQPNTYIPASFVDQPTYFFVKPKPAELCHVVWAVYRGVENGKHVFAMPANEDGNNTMDLEGALCIDIDPDYTGALVNGQVTFNIGQVYDLVGFIKKMPADDGGNAPRRSSTGINPKDTEPGTELSLSVIDVITDGYIITGVNDLTESVPRQVSSVTYYNVAGHASSKPFPGINIVVTRYTDGSATTAKVLR
ncbi:MAG: chitobiase/beta-hexosaminidase C-terminal domain-containing protein [Muribaculaceae bacterium]|nr:chitobiase/beta-hexosaminidase C-terminal domain-containing protein [Muribaculaceae bacterium]